MPPEPALDDAPLTLEQALVEVSSLLVSTSRADLRDVLRVVGHALRAECAYLVEAPAEDGILVRSDAGRVTVWHRDGPAAAAAWASAGRSEGPRALRLLDRLGTATAGTDAEPPPGLAIPILSRDDRFIGYLGIEGLDAGSRPLDEHNRVLTVFGDLLASYFGRTRTERELSESEERWRKLVEVHPEPILVAVDGRISYANAAGAHLVGVASPASLEGYAVQDFIGADHSDGVERQLAEQVAGRELMPFEHEILRLDGDTRIVETTAAHVPFHGSSAVLIVLRDVTERRESEERYRTFVQTIAEAVWRVDLVPPVPLEATPERQAEMLYRRGRLAECNAMMLQVMGVQTPEAVLGQPVHALVPSLDTAIFQRFVEQGGRLQNYELAVTGRDRPTRYFTVNAVGRAYRGRLHRIWGSCVEVTERVELERRMVDALEEQQERIGHDLHDGVGQLLTGIRMLSENLATRHFAPEAEGATTARRITQFAGEATERVREICRGLAPPQLYQEGLTDALSGLVSHIQSVSGLRCSFKSDLAVEITQRNTKIQLYRIVQEALNNALKHSGATHLWVRVHDEEGYLVVEVEDDGKGFDLAEADAAKQSIGLYSMQRRASSIRGTLEIDSEPDVGTTIRVTRPLPAAAD